MKKWIVPILFLGFTATAHADLRWASPFVILYTTNTFFTSQTFLSSITVTMGTTSFNGQAYIWPSTAPAQGQHLVVNQIMGSNYYLTWGGDQEGSSGSGGSDNLGSHVSTMPLTLPFSFTASSGVVISSFVAGIVIIGSQPAPGLVNIATAPGYVGEMVRVSTGETVLVNFTSSSGSLNFPMGIGISSMTSRGNISVGSGGKYFGAPFNDLNNCLYCFDRGSVGFNGAGGIAGNINAVIGGAIIGGFDFNNSRIYANGSTVFRGPDGTQAAPLFTFNNATNVGMFRTPPNSDLGFAANGLERLRITNAGGVVVGRLGVAGASLHVGSSTIPNTPIFVVSSDTAKFSVTGGSASFSYGGSSVTISSSNFIVSDTSMTLRTGGRGSGGGISVATYTVEGISLLRSTWSAFSCDGMTVVYDTGTIASNTTLTYSASVFGGNTICGAKAGMIEQVNTATAGPRIKSLAGLPSSFTIYNPDAVNAQGFWVEFWVR